MIQKICNKYQYQQKYYKLLNYKLKLDIMYQLILNYGLFIILYIRKNG